MEREFERILKREKKIRAANTEFFCILGVAMCLLAIVPICLRLAGFPTAGPGASELCFISAAFGFIAYYHTKQSKVNVEIVKAIKEIRERLDQEAGKKQFE
jgi:hypothetical protein